MRESEELTPYDRIAIIGLGLIGGSIARAARARRLSQSIVGCDSNEMALSYGRKHGFLDSATQDPRIAAAGSDLIILATPPSALAGIMQAIAPSLQAGALVMDVASVKQPAIAAIAPHLPPQVHFIPAHPIAGSEQSGVTASRADLFERRFVIVTPEEPAETLPLQHATRFWQALGARIEAMPPQLHDLIYAYVSHLPQLLAFAAAPCLNIAIPFPGYAGTLQKFLRLSGSDAALWMQLFLLNKTYLLQALERYLDIVTHIEGELAQAPDDEADDENEALAQSVLFPRIAASCLVTTVMEAERHAGIPFLRYAGTGFADFTAPASPPPDEDIERISGQHRFVRALLSAYAARLTQFHQAIAQEDIKGLAQLILRR